jgi:hypothetical protein
MGDENEPIPSCTTYPSSNLCNTLALDHKSQSAHCCKENDNGKLQPQRSATVAALHGVAEHSTGLALMKLLCPQSSNAHGLGVKKELLTSPSCKRLQQPLQERRNDINAHISDTTRLPSQCPRSIARGGRAAGQMLNGHDLSSTQEPPVNDGSKMSMPASAALQSLGRTCSETTSSNLQASAALGTEYFVATCNQTKVQPGLQAGVGTQQHSMLPIGLEVEHGVQHGNNFAVTGPIVGQFGTESKLRLLPNTASTDSGGALNGRKNKHSDIIASCYPAVCGGQPALQQYPLGTRQDPSPDAIRRRALGQSWQLARWQVEEKATKESVTVGTQVDFTCADAQIARTSAEELDALQRASSIAPTCARIVLNAGSSLVVSSGPSHLDNPPNITVIACSPATAVAEHGAHTAVQWNSGTRSTNETPLRSNSSSCHKWLRNKNDVPHSGNVQSSEGRSHQLPNEQILRPGSPRPGSTTAPSASVHTTDNNLTQQVVKRFDMYTQTPKRRAHRKRKRGLDLSPQAMNPWLHSHVVNGRTEPQVHNNHGEITAQETGVLPPHSEGSASSDRQLASCHEHWSSSPDTVSKRTGGASQERKQQVPGCRTPPRLALQQATGEKGATPSHCGPFPVSRDVEGDKSSHFQSSPALRQRAPFCRLVPGTGPSARAALGTTCTQATHDAAVLDSAGKPSACISFSQVHCHSSAAACEHALRGQSINLCGPRPSGLPSFRPVSSCIPNFASAYLDSCGLHESFKWLNNRIQTPHMDTSCDRLATAFGEKPCQLLYHEIVSGVTAPGIERFGITCRTG